MLIHSSQPISADKDCRIAIVTDCPGEADIRGGKLLIGQSGKELTRMLAEAEIIREECFITSVFQTRPPGDNVYAWCLKKKEADDAWKNMGNSGKYPFAGFKSGAYLHPAHLGNIKRLHSELVVYNPNLIIALGNIPLWAISGESGVTKVRGTLIEVDLIGGTRRYKVLPTYAPEYIFRQWENRSVLVADLIKARRECGTQSYTRPERELWIEPSLTDISEFINQHLVKANEFSVDIETRYDQITCIGFGTKSHAICIPFLDTRKPGWSYWQTPEAEFDALGMVEFVLKLPANKIFQNGMFDMQWIWRRWGFTVSAPINDTMLLHHSMFPEMQKGLAFLGSIYTNEASWKKMRPRNVTIGKREDALE